MKKPNFKRKELFFLVVIFLLSLSIRLIKLGNVPNGLTVDEADMGYNAFSILKTGADVYGRKFPLFFQSLDDYKAAFGIYAPLPAVALFGLNELSVRIVPAILGAFTPLLAFLLLKLLYSKSRYLPSVTAVVMAFAPWNIAISRANLPYIELIFFYLLFIYSFQLGVIKNSKFLLIAAGTLGITLYVYYAAIIYLPFTLLTITLIYRDFLKKNFKIVFVGLSLLVILSMPAFLHYTKKESKTRLNAISVLTADVTLPTSIAEIEQDKQEEQPFPQIIHNRRLVYVSALLDNYADYFNLDYLFVNAKNIRYFYTNNVGLFYLLELPFVLYGLYIIIKRRDKPDLLILALLLIGPIPAALTLGSPFPHRALLAILSLQLISAIGAAAILSKIRSSTSLKLALIAIYAASIYFFLHQYFVHSPREFTSEFDNGAWFSTVKEAIPLVNQYKRKYDKVVFTWSSQKLVPAVYFLFYNQVDPRILQAKASLWTNEPPSYKQIYNQIGNIEFRSINWEQDKNLRKTLFVGYPKEFDQAARIIDKTYLPSGQTHFVFVQTQ